MEKIATFGEIMARLEPDGLLRFIQRPSKLNISFAGAEANVAASIAIMGGSSKFISALPKHDIANACMHQLNSIGVDTKHVKLMDKGRLGLYFVETGANQRPSKVIYDREYSTISLCKPNDFEWDSVFENCNWFHISGITPALSESAADTSLEAVKQAKNKGITVSCDLNFRKNLWNWDNTLASKELARKVMKNILNYTDILIGNEEDAADVLGIVPENTDVNKGILDIKQYVDVAKKISKGYPAIKKIAITLRQSFSASHNNWGAMLYDIKKDKAFYAPEFNGEYHPYEIKNIVDRVGGGDSFAAGLIFALTTDGLDNCQTAIQYAVASSCLAHSIVNDFNYSTRSEVEALMNGNASGRVIR